MSLLDRVLAEPEICSAPPVLVDVGAASGVSPLWRRLARHAVVVAFEPDAREAAPLSREQSAFRRWIYVPALVAAEVPADGQIDFHLTRSPQCSSMLRPHAVALERWAIASFFEVVETRRMPATTLEAALRRYDLPAIDWLKCDTQGLDLTLYRSLSDEHRAQLLVSEFEPGLIDGYVGEDSMAQVLSAMRHEPFWLAECRIEGTPLAAEANSSRWHRRLAPTAPGWSNLRYLRDVSQSPGALDRRAYLLLWVFATLERQPAYAYRVAVAGRARFGAGLFDEMQQASRRHLRWASLRRLPRWLIRSLSQRLG